MKRILLSFCFLLMICPAFSQIYLRANIGYNLPVGKSLIDYEEHYVAANADAATLKGVYGSYGTGLSFQLGFGGAFSNAILGYDIELSYVLGKKHDFSSEYVSDFYESRSDGTRQSRSFQFAPSLTFTAVTGKFQPFVRVGPVLAITKVEYKESAFENYTPSAYTYEFEYTGDLQIGFKGALGVSYPLNDHIHLFTEMNFISLTFAPDKRKTTAHTEDGEDAMSDIDPDDIEIELVEEAELEGEGPTPTLKSSYSMSTLGLQFGVRFVF